MLAIILTRRDFREYDQIISLYTKEAGKREVLARGVKKITSKNSGSLEPFSLVEAEIVPGKEIDHLTRAQPINIFKNIRGDLNKITMAYFFVKALSDSMALNQNDERIFGLVESWLVFLDAAPLGKLLLLTAGIFKLFSCLGFTPQLAKCVLCGAPLSPEISYYFDFAEGGVLCNKCWATQPLHQAHSILISLATIASLQLLLTSNWPAIFSITLDKKEAVMLHNIVYHFALYHSGNRVSDWRHMEKLLK